MLAIVLKTTGATVRARGDMYKAGGAVSALVQWKELGSTGGCSKLWRGSTTRRHNIS